jgi:ABC-type phosphate transport system auxiliary subunit
MDFNRATLLQGNKAGSFNGNLKDASLSQFPSPIRMDADNSTFNLATYQNVSTDLQSMQEELERAKLALSEADKERNELIRLLEVVAASPLEMQSVVEAYLQNYGI